MTGPKPVTLVLLCIVATALTYLLMHLVVAPRLVASAVDVPALVGLMPEQARTLTDARGLLLVLDGEKPLPEEVRVAPGALCEQSPLGGSRLHPGEKVHVFVGRAAQVQRMPVVAGLTLEAARRLLTDQGLRLGTQRDVDAPPVVPGQAPPVPGTVVDAQPAAGAEVRRGDMVVLSVVKAPAQVAVPDLRGRSASGASKLLEQAGLVLGSRRSGVDDNAADGVVLRQSPAAGTQVAKGDKVDIVVNE